LTKETLESICGLDVLKHHGLLLKTFILHDEEEISGKEFDYH
jgi:hypothetical protein